ncbi:hypothetical protein GW17_00054505 [Ensete ventricosum]|nr:hypothetical protein GW17_00054505 [Ensete ventricosum]
MEELSYNQMMGQNQVWASSQGSDDAVGARREFAKGIKKLIGNTLGDHRRKTVRLTVRMSETIGLTRVRSLFSLMVLMIFVESKERVSSLGAVEVEPQGWLTNYVVVILEVPNLTSRKGAQSPDIKSRWGDVSLLARTFYIRIALQALLRYRVIFLMSKYYGILCHGQEVSTAWSCPCA